MRHVAIALSVFIAVLFFPARQRALAQDADPVSPESEVGYELALSGATSGERGGALRLSGIAYEVHGLSELRASAGLEIEVAITAWRRDGSGRDRIETARTRSGEGGRFEIVITVPAVDLSSPLLEISIARAQRPGRTFRFGLAQLASRDLDVLSDRMRYEPGETVHAWSLLRRTRGRAPIAGSALRLQLLDPRGAPAAEAHASTGQSGAVSADLVIPPGADPGSWTLVVSGEDVQQAQRSILVVQRTVERLDVRVTLDHELLEPGATVRGRVQVSTPSGSPVRGATVLVSLGDPSATALELVTDELGVARIDGHAPSFLSGDVATMTVIARVTHAAYGTLAASATYTMARTRWLVTATPEAGGIVPELDTELFLSVADPRGQPIAAGTELEVRGLGLRGGRASASTDAHGIAQVTVRLPRGAAARMQGGACSNDPSTSFEVEVSASPPIVARICVRVAIDAQLLARARAPIVAPGAPLEIEVQRRPEASGRPVLLELLDGGRALAFGWIDASARAGSIAIPSDVQGTLRVRARAVAPADASRPIDRPGATFVGKGSIGGVIVRPGDAFALDLSPDRELHRVRERAEIVAHASIAPDGGWLTLVARDEAAHGGERDYAREWIAAELRDAIRGAIDPAHDRFVRSAIASGLPIDTGVSEPPPLVREPWDSGGSVWVPAHGIGGGVPRDPIAAREELRRRGVRAAMVTIERVVSRLGAASDPERAQFTRASGRSVAFRPDLIEQLIRSGELAEGNARTLGGQRMTVAMLTELDPSFTFDRVARRVARARLVRLMSALAAFASPDDPAAARASSAQPPDRWLARMVQLGMIEAEALIDPWGRPFEFRRVSGRPAFVISERAIDFELSSPGPDGALGNADDVKSPFERVVPERTPYAVASGEDALIEQLSRLAPGQRVLATMAQAYSRLGLAAEEERRVGPVTAAVSESAMPPAGASPAPAGGYEEMRGGGAGGAIALDSTTELAEAPMAQAPPQEPRRRRSREPSDTDADGVPDELDQEQSQSDAPVDGRMQAMGELVREDFPATLFFLGEAALDGSGSARITIPLADALTTYRIEAIAWSGSGWITSGRTRVRVDQDAMVDAPVPEVAVIGDVIRLPVRLQNRSRGPMHARLAIETEGGVAIDLGSLDPIEVGAGEGAEAIVELRPQGAGSGHVVIRASREDGSSLDAVRRPIRVLEDARRVIERRDELVGAGDAIEVEIPARALPRGPAQLRVSIAGSIVGDPAVWAIERDPLWGGWALSMSDREIPEAIRDFAAAYVRLEEYQDESRWYGYDALQLALAIAIAWRGEALDERSGSAILRFLTQQLPDPGERARDDIAIGPVSPSWLLIALAPAIAHERERGELREDLERLIDRLRRLASAEGAQAIEAPATWARVAAALELSRRGALDARAKEMLRRVERHVIAVGDQAWLEPDQDEGSIEPRIVPSMLLALARIADGEPRSAVPLIRSIAQVARGAARWDPRARALASAAAARLTRGSVTELSATLDGAPIAIALEGGIATATIEELPAPGRHTIRIALPAGALALATIELRYALPWDVRPARESALELAWTGEPGARDVRSGLVLEIRNRGARVVARPIVEIELPAGAELDETTRERLSQLLAAPAEIEGSTMRLELRPMAPAGFLRLPIRARWSVGGTLRGLGASAWDDASPPHADARPVRVLASREVVLADRGTELDEAEVEESEPPRPQPPPIPILRPLAEEVSR